MRLASALVVFLVACGKGGGGGDAKHDAFVLREMAKAFGFAASACAYKLHAVQLTGSHVAERTGNRVEEARAWGEIVPPCNDALGRRSVAGPHTWSITFDMQQESTIGFERKGESDAADVAPLYGSRTATLRARGLTDRTEGTAVLECPGRPPLEATMKDKHFVFEKVPLPAPRTLIACVLNAGDQRTTPVNLGTLGDADLQNLEVIVGAAPVAQPRAEPGEETCTDAKVKEDTPLRAEPSADGFELTTLPACQEICRIRDENGFALVRASPRDVGYVAISAIGDSPACK